MWEMVKMPMAVTLYKRETDTENRIEKRKKMCHAEL